MPIPFDRSGSQQGDQLYTPMSATAQGQVQQQNQGIQKKDDAVSVADKKRYTEFKQRIDICKLYRRKLIANWTICIDYRRGKPFASQTDEDQVAVNLDWSMTKAKQALLFSQIPQIRLDHVPDTLPKNNPWAIAFEHRLNDTIRAAGVEAALDECLPDCINAAGLGVVLVSYDAITEDRQVPSIDLSQMDPQIAMQVLQSGQLNGQPVPTETVPHVLDKRYTIQRISPADFLWPINFTGSNFDNAPWLGRSGRLPWAEAALKFGLKDEDRDTLIGEDRPQWDKLTHDVERDKVQADDMVGFDEIYYKEVCYDTNAKSYSTIHYMVYVAGKEIPVIDGVWKGQQITNEGATIGALRYPIRVLTLTYVTDDAVPPSDSAIGRPQVNEINRARTQMIRQRERSMPVRWFDVNRVDPAIQVGLMRGTWQTMIPVQGEGSRVIGEVARATMPQENFLFDRIAKSDLSEEWTIEPLPEHVPNAQGSPEAGPSGFTTRIGRERAKVGAFFVGIAEVLGGLLCLYEDPGSLGQGFDPAVSRILKYSILADSTVLVDANQRLARLNQFVNVYAKSGWINVEPVLQEIATLTGLDPTVVITPPQPKPPVEPNISLRLTGVEDMLNPLALAFLIKSGQAPAPELIEQAKQLIQQAVVAPPGLQTPSQIQPQGGLPMLPDGGQPLPPPVLAPPPGTPLPQPAPPALGAAHPNWTVLRTLDKSAEGTQK